ncbi:peptidoglycan -binding protein [Pikeienuella piscinae]|uniref:Peptidoglycan-binding protein n=1 Tax=Pikeienuella piscinae TaxID=2748098 RepID=A0A7L5C044_9RHOB|nr:peptidoglycan -binding protein [Pikeienuella piscinae]QIE55494.1 peptidoglycan -binding protein [Pikeienuella piscinae]
MAVGRLSDRARTSAAIWPGFVDAMTALLLVLMFVLSIFMIVQFVLRMQLTGQETLIEIQEDRIGELNAQLSSLSNVLAMEVTRGEDLDRELNVARATLIDREGEIDRLGGVVAGLNEEKAALQNRVASFETQVASLLAERAKLEDNVAALETARDAEIDAKEALNLALAKAREEIDAEAEAARRAAAEREALEALVASLKDEKAEGEAAISKLKAEDAANLALIAALEGERDEGRERIAELEAAREAAANDAAANAEARDAALARVGELTAELNEEERLRLASLAAAEALRRKLRDADAELTSMTLALEEKRRQAEETLTLLAAAEAAKRELEAARDDLNAELSEQEKAKEREKALLALARSRLAERETEVSEQAKALALLNEQAAELRAQLGQLSAQLGASEAKDRESEAEIANLGARLNAALAREVQLKAREAERLKAENESLESYRSEFFGEMRKALGDRRDIRIVGDRFIFQSEVLFDTGSAELGFEGRAELSNLGGALREVIDRIPDGIDWLLVVEGHTDDVPISGGRFRDNWELSQARALSVVRFLTEFEDVPAERLAALGYGQFQPLDTRDTPEARARNRRIELKFTERPPRGG